LTTIALDLKTANEREWAPVATLLAKVQETTGDSIEAAFVDQVYVGEQAAAGSERRNVSRKSSRALLFC